jgi:hypothetical protein
MIVKSWGFVTLHRPPFCRPVTRSHTSDGFKLVEFFFFSELLLRLVEGAPFVSF